MLICSGIDDKYVWPWLVMAYSANLNKSETQLVFMVGNVNSGLSAYSKQVITDFCNALGVDLKIVDFSLQIQLKTTYQPLTVYTKLLFLDSLDDDFIWIDADCLLLTGWIGIQEYFEVFDSDPSKVISACLDSQTNSQPDSKVVNQAFLVAKEGYFNSGLFLSNPKAWRLSGFHERWKMVGISHSEMGFKYHDQDILNYLLAGKNSVLPGNYNVMSVQPFVLATRILHFTGKPKPWKFMGNHRSYALAQLLFTRNSKSDTSEDRFDKKLKYLLYWSAEESLLSFIATQTSKLIIDVNRVRNFSSNGFSRRDQVEFLILCFISKPFFRSWFS